MKKLKRREKKSNLTQEQREERERKIIKLQAILSVAGFVCGIISCAILLIGRLFF